MTAQQLIQKSKSVIQLGQNRISSSLNMLSQPTDWPKDAPDYHSTEGWDFQKKMIEDKLRKQIKK